MHNADTLSLAQKVREGQDRELPHASVETTEDQYRKK